MKKLVLVGFLVMLAAACTTAQREALIGALAADPPQGQPAPVAAASTVTVTPAFSTVSFPTPIPTLSGPLGTLTAIAPLFASPTPNATPYVITYSQKPHFIEFYAWW